MTETFSVLIAIGIVMILVVICVLSSMYLIKNKIYLNNKELDGHKRKSDEHFGKLSSNEKPFSLKELPENVKNDLRQIIIDGEKEYELNQLRAEANQRYLKSRATIKISEISDEFHKIYYQYKDVNVKYAIMKIVNFQANHKIKELEYFKPVILKKVGKTFHINIRTALDMRRIIKFMNIPEKTGKYNKKVLAIMVSIAIDLLSKKIVPEKDKYLWENNPNDMINKW